MYISVATRIADTTGMTLPRVRFLYLFSLTPSPANRTIQRGSPSSPVRVSDWPYVSPAVYLARAFAIRDECVPRIDATETSLDNKRTAIVASCRLLSDSRCRCFAHSGNFGLADSGGQERETITPRIGLETESADSRRAMPACDWTAGRVFYQVPLSARRAPREMTREKTNAESVREKIRPDHGLLFIVLER